MKTRYMQFENLPGLEEVIRRESSTRNLGDLIGIVELVRLCAKSRQSNDQAMDNICWENITSNWSNKESEGFVVVKK